MTLAEVEERLRKILKRKVGSHSHTVRDGVFEITASAERDLHELLADLERARVEQVGHG